MRTQVVCLGFLLSGLGLSPDPKNLQKIRSWPIPKKVKETRGFLGLVSFYRHFIRGFSKIAAPLSDLTKKEIKFLWDDQCQEAFTTLVDSLTSDLVVASPDFDKEFILRTDASLLAIGSVLLQLHDNKEKVISFDSKKLTEQRWINRAEVDYI